EIDNVMTAESSYEQWKDSDDDDDGTAAAAESTEITMNSSEPEAESEGNLIELDGNQEDANELANISNVSDSRVVSARERSLTYEQNQLLSQFSL
ncbi:hypothetical protein CANMA_002013, partial [Candida margitis]|uniref:uncharacterized protein n=1 Tax=Candida margitis TaxID=1775924 RepID=UPI0022277466